MLPWKEEVGSGLVSRLAAWGLPLGLVPGLESPSLCPLMRFTHLFIICPSPTGMQGFSTLLAATAWSSTQRVAGAQ